MTEVEYECEQLNKEPCGFEPEDDGRSCVKADRSDPKTILSHCSEPNSLDYSPSCSVFESDEIDSSPFDNDPFERESGVESVDGDWLQTESCHTPPSDFDLDLTEEQALETLKYFSKYLFCLLH